MVASIVRYVTLWEAASEFQRNFPVWMDGPFIDLKADVRLVMVLGSRP
jgi:hypothetical protein